MWTIAFLTQKGGTGKTTLAASLAVAAAEAGEKVITLDLDPQGSLARWGERRVAAQAPNKVMVEPLERERLPRLRAILDGLAGVGFTLVVFDTAGADSAAVRLVADSVDMCLLPSRPSRLDVEATASTFRAVFLARRRAAFVLNQCPPTYRSTRASDAAKDLTSLGVLADPMLSARIRMRSRRGWASPSMPAEAGRHRRSRRCGVGLGPSLDRPGPTGCRRCSSRKRLPPSAAAALSARHARTA
jgi:chromosome partitioning protein